MKPVIVITIAVGCSVVAVFAIIGGISFYLSTELKAESPNIVVIMVDDLDEPSFNILLENGLMPNLQEYLIDDGTRFSNSFVTTPVCCPARATFFTGQYTHNHHVFTNKAPTGGVSSFDDTSTLSTWLKDSGYHTGLVGKYMNEYGITTSRTYVPPGWDEWKALLGLGGLHVYDYSINDNGKDIKFGTNESDYRTDVLAQFSSELITKWDATDDSVPFFLSVMPAAPHAEVRAEKCVIREVKIFLIRPPERYAGTAKEIPLPMVPSFNEADISDKRPFWKENYSVINQSDFECIETLFQNRLETMRAVDDMIGLLIQTLKDTNELENTVIIFTSDNGWLLGEHRAIGKGRVYEESIRVPLIIRAPGYSGLQTTSHLVINNDLAPTIIDFANSKSKLEMDGRSLKPLLENPNTNDWRGKILIEFFWDNPHYEWFAVRTNSSIYMDVLFLDTDITEAEFYDLNKDPYQLDSQHDCITNYCKEQIKQHEKWISQLKTCGNGSCFILEN